MALKPHFNFPRRTTLSIFYLTALASAVAIGIAQRATNFRTFLIVLATAGVLVAVLFLLRFLRSNDEREQQVNHHALTFAFVGTLLFSLGIGFLQSFGFHSVSWLGILVLMIVLWSMGLILYSWRYR